MGNCINLMFSSHPQKKIRVLLCNGGEEEFTAPTRVKKITSGTYSGYKLVHYARLCSPLPPDTKLEPGELYFLMPKLPQPCSLPASRKMRGNNGRSGGRKVKIMVTRQQLEYLLSKSARKCQSVENPVPVPFNGNLGITGECRKWHPSLAAIPELQNF